MKSQLIIPTESPSLHLRELNKPSDDRTVFELAQANQVYWEPFASDVLYAHKYITWVMYSRREAEMQGETRLGIFSEESLVGLFSIMDYRAYPEVGNWCGIWLDRIETGKGHATMALRSVARYIREQKDDNNHWLATTIDQENGASRALFERVGFSVTDEPLPHQAASDLAYRLAPTDEMT